MRAIVYAVIALAIAGPAFAQGTARGEVRGIEIVEYGIFTAELQSSKRDVHGIRQNLSTNFRLAVKTNTVPLQIGVRFGVQYRVNGRPADATFPIRSIVVFPPAGVRSPAEAKLLTRSESINNSKVGEITYTGYRLDDSFELVPGVWTIELWHGERKLAEQKFMLGNP